MVKNKITTDRLYKASIITFVLAILYSVVAVFSGKVDSHLFFNTDALFLPTLFKGLFIDGFSMDTWMFPDAPFIFPDFLLYGVFETVIKNFRISSLLTSLTFFSGIFIGLYYIADLLTNSHRKARRTVVLSFLSVFIVLISNGTLLAHTILLLSPVFHEGELLVSIALVILTLRTLKKERLFEYALFFLLLILVTLSDKSIVKDFTLPFLAVIPIFYFVARNKFKVLTRLGVLAIIASLIGNILYQTIIPFPAVTPGTRGLSILARENVVKISEDFSTFFSSSELNIGVAKKQFAFANSMGAFSVFTIAALVLLISSTAKNIKNKKNKRELFLSLFILLQFLFNFIGTIFYGYYKSLIHIRYFTNLLIFPVFWLAFYLGLYVTNMTSKKALSQLATLSVGIASLLLAINFLTLDYNETQGALNYKPPNMTCIDDAIKANNLKYGLSDVWNSAPTTLFSQEGAEVRHVTQNGEHVAPFHWLTPYASFFQKSGEDSTFPEYSFVLTQYLDKQKIINTFGDPSKIIDCDSTKVFVYNTEEATKKSAQFEGALKSRYMNHFLKTKGDKISMLAKDFDNYIFDANIRTEELTTLQTVDDRQLKTLNTAGVVAQGPALALEKGVYDFKLFYKGNAENVGTLILNTTPPKGSANIQLNNTKGEIDSVGGTIEIGRDLEKIRSNAYNVGAFRASIEYTGQGELIIDRIEITRLE